MRYPFFDTEEYKIKQANIAHLNWQKGKYKSLVKKEQRYCLNHLCRNSFVIPPSDKQKYCSQICWYLVKRNHRIETAPLCIDCGKLIIQKGASKFCSLKCQFNKKYNDYIKRWRRGLESGNRGVTTRTISGHLRRYLFEKFKDKCSRCGWNKQHPKTLVVPLEINHIDGNAENNKEQNLELICPNCHALTPNFRNLNKGNGRKWRLNYIKTHKMLLLH